MKRSKKKPAPIKPEPIKTPWHPEYFEDLEELAERLKAPLGTLVGILDRRYVPGWALCGRLESLTNISEEVWLRSQASTHPVFLTPPVGSVMPVVQETTAWAAETWNEHLFEILSNHAVLGGVSVVASLIYRRLGLRSKLRADTLACHTGIEASEWLINRTSQHPGFCGPVKSEEIIWA